MHRLKKNCCGYRSISVKFKMAASNQFQCPIWQQLKSNCSINCMTQLKHQQEWFVFCTIFFQSSDFLGKQWSDFTYLKQVLFFTNLLSINPGGERLLSSGYWLNSETRTVFMGRNKAIRHPVPKKWSTAGTKWHTIQINCFPTYLPSE